MMTVGIDRQGRMQEQAEVSAVADRPQAAGTAGMPLIVQFARVLDGQDMAPGRAPRDLLAAMLVNLFNAHGLIPKPTAKPDFLGAIACQFTQPDGEMLRHPLRQQSPFFAAARLGSRQPPSKKMPFPTSRISRPTQSHTTANQRNIRFTTRVSLSHQRVMCIDQPLEGGRPL